MLVIVWEVFWLFWIISTWVDCFCPDIKIHKSQRTIFSNLTVFKSTISNRKPHKADLSGWSLPLPLIGIILFHLGAYEPCYSQGQCWHRERLLSSTDFRDDGVETAVTMSKKKTTYCVKFPWKIRDGLNQPAASWVISSPKTRGKKKTSCS